MDEPETVEEGVTVDVPVSDAVGVCVEVGLCVGSAVTEPLIESLLVAEGLAP